MRKATHSLGDGGRTRGTAVPTPLPGPRVLGVVSPQTLRPLPRGSTQPWTPPPGSQAAVANPLASALEGETDFYRWPSKGCVGGRGRAPLGRRVTGGAKRRAKGALWGTLRVCPQDSPRQPALLHTLGIFPKSSICLPTGVRGFYR